MQFQHCRDMEYRVWTGKYGRKRSSMANLLKTDWEEQVIPSINSFIYPAKSKKLANLSGLLPERCNDSHRQSGIYNLHRRA